MKTTFIVIALLVAGLASVPLFGASRALLAVATAVMMAGAFCAAMTTWYDRKLTSRGSALCLLSLIFASVSVEFYEDSEVGAVASVLYWSCFYGFWLNLMRTHTRSRLNTQPNYPPQPPSSLPSSPQKHLENAPHHSHS